MFLDHLEVLDRDVPHTLQVGGECGIGSAALPLGKGCLQVLGGGGNGSLFHLEGCTVAQHITSTLVGGSGAFLVVEVPYALLAIQRWLAMAPAPLPTRDASTTCCSASTVSYLSWNRASG